MYKYIKGFVKTFFLYFTVLSDQVLLDAGPALQKVQGEKCSLQRAFRIILYSFNDVFKIVSGRNL